mgnify:CR=1 FL=1
MPRIGDGGRHAFLRVHADLHRCGWNQTPGHALQAATDGVSATVNIAHVPDQPGVFDIIAINAQPQNRARQRPPAFIDFQQFITVQQLATRHAVVVEDKKLKHFDIRVIRQKILGFLQGSKRRGGTHGNTHQFVSERRKGAP